MGNLFDLIAATARQTAAKHVIDTDPQTASPMPASPADPAVASDDASEPRLNAWTVTRNGVPVCRMVGQPRTHIEARELARGRWPDADVLKG